MSDGSIVPYQPQPSPNHYGPPPPHGYGPPAHDPYRYPPPGHGYGPPQLGYGAPPPPGNGYGAAPPPHIGYGHPPPHGYGYPPPPGYGPPPPAYGYPPPGGYAYPPPPPGHYPPHPGYAQYPAPHPGYPARSRSPRRGGLPDATKYTCRFYIGIPNEEEFRVVRRIIGAGGSKMKDIVGKTNGDAKLRLRGRGSGFVERDTKAESQEPLQLCVSCPKPDTYAIAIRAVDELLRSVYREYDQWCAERGRPERAPEIKMTERHHRGDGDDGGAGGGDDKGGGGKRRGGRNRKPKALQDQCARDEDEFESEGDQEAPADRGIPPAGAPTVEEIERLIEDRNQARRRSDFREADRIRDDLKNRGVVLSDEKGAHGAGLTVTSWRYWRD